MVSDRTLVDDWHVVARSEDIGRGEMAAARLLEEDVLLWRSSDGLQAWQDRCPHRGAKLSLGRCDGGKVTCPYHGLEYGPDGHCLRYPAHPAMTPSAKAQVNTYKTIERYGLIWVSLGEPAHDVPDFPEADGGGYRIYFGGRFPYETSATRAIENFLDLSHFPFVHGGYLGQEPHTEVADYDVEVSDAGLIARNCRFWQPKPTNTLDVDGVEVDYAYFVSRPLTARLTKDIGERNADGSAMMEAIVLTMTPVEEERSVGWVLLASNYDDAYDEEEVVAFTELVVGQDVRVVESQRPKLLPIEIDEEFHMRCDRTSIEYRRWLKTLGLTYGTTQTNP